ncbi:4a-hydroxytetrahydrobiopterin dehydratase [Patescibacteria group bacterium]|nr:4a-hydroxytetrahydrobiopterin dehydratase [Patescibacteria group bacterium]
MDLTQKHCVPCEGGTAPLTKKEAEAMMQHVPGWHLMQDAKKGQLSIGRDFEFKDFKEAMAFVNKAAEIANAEDHHPDIYVFYNVVKLQLSTHAIKGLSENDFIVAAKINSL